MPSLLGVSVALALTGLVPKGVDRFGDGETIVRYAQVHEGLPVIGRGTSQRFSATGKPLFSADELEADLPSTIPTLTPADAATIAGASPNDAHLVIGLTLDHGARLAYAVVPKIPAGVPMSPRTIVDAQTGEILEARDLLTYANARVYTFNPVKTPDLNTQKLALDPSGGFLSNDFIQSTNCIDHKTVKTLSIGVDVNVHICDLEQVAKADPNGDFLYDPSDVAGSPASRTDEFSEVAIYYHAGKAYSFYRELQGDPEAQIVVDKPLRLIANLQIAHGVFNGDITAAGDPETPLDPFQNAFFAPAAGGLGEIFQQLYGFTAGALWFGQGPKRDYAYDGDVVYHEFTHAVVDNTLQLVSWHADKFGAIDAPGAMNEGLADFFSCAITGDPDVGEYASLDVGITTGVIRTLSNHDTCSSLVGEVHADSTVFSGGLWEARSALTEADRHSFDKALYKTMRQSPGRGDVGYEDLINLFLQVLRADLPAGATNLETAMKGRGLLVDGGGCDRIRDFDGTTAISSADKTIGFVAPGKQSVNIKGTAPGIIQVKAALPAKATSLRVSFGQRQSSSMSTQGKPFTPVVLVKLTDPIVWDAKSATGHDATLSAAATAGVADLMLPADATADTIYVQIANTGDNDGAYDHVNLTFMGADGTVVGTPPAGASPPAEPSSKIVTHGCGISAAPGMLGSGAWLFGVAALARIARRKNKR